MLSSADGLSSCFPTLVAPDAVFEEVFFLDFLASRDDNDADLPPFLCFAPPLSSKMDWMLVLLASDGLWIANGANLLWADAVASNMEAKHKLDFIGLIFF